MDLSAFRYRFRSATRPAAQCSEGRIGGAPFKSPSVIVQEPPRFLTAQYFFIEKKC